MTHAIETMKMLAETTFIFSGWMVAIMTTFGLAVLVVQKLIEEILQRMGYAGMLLSFAIRDLNKSPRPFWARIVLRRQ